MANTETTPNGLVQSLSGFLRAVVGVLRNRAELLIVELQEEKYRLVELLILLGIGLLLGLMVLLLFTGILIFLFPESYRVYVASGLGIIYAAGIMMLVHPIKSRLQVEPFPETVNQVKKDWECLTPPR